MIGGPGVSIVRLEHDTTEEALPFSEAVHLKSSPSLYIDI